MNFIVRVITQLIQKNLRTTKTEHLQLARAYRPVSQQMLPRWRNLGTSLTPYHFMEEKK